MRKETITGVMPLPIRRMLELLSQETYDVLEEIRLRVGQPILLFIQGRELGLGECGICELDKSYILTRENITGILQCMSDFSLYALEEEIRQGFITLEGGHRVGLVGKTVLERNAIKTLKYISGINIRIAHEVVGCSQKIMPYILSRDRVFHTLIISPPGCGKTTLLRDMIRQLSNGFSGYGPYTVGVVDERSEIAACYQGIPQNDVGMRTDVLDACPKVEGMRMLLRSMSPQIIAVDEIGSEEDGKAILEILNAGVSLICTAHGKDLAECTRRPVLKALLAQGLFERIIIISHKKGPCTVEDIIDGGRRQSLMR